MTVSVILSLPTWTTNGAHVILKTKHQSHETDPIEDPGKRIGETERKRTEREVLRFQFQILIQRYK